MCCLLVDVASSPLVGKLFFTATTVASMASYVFDIGSDVVLAGGYFWDGDVWWGAWTTTFVALPWIASWAFSTVRDKLIRSMGDRSLRFLALLNLYPLYWSGLALRHCWRSSGKKRYDRMHAKLLNASNFVRLFEVVLEAAPQSALQIYIVGRRNKMNLLQLVAIVTSTLSLVLGMVNGVFATMRFNDRFKRFALLKTLFLLWTTMQVTTFVLPLALFSSLKGRVHPAWLGLLPYFYLHLYQSSFSSFVYPIDGFSPKRRRKGGDVAFMLIDCRSAARRRLSRCLAILVQTKSLLISLFLSLFWFGSLIPFLADSGGFSFRAWSHVPASLRKWIVGDLVDAKNHIPINGAAANDADNAAAPIYDWAICNVGSANATASSANWWTAFFDRELCVTELAPQLFAFFLAGGVSLFVFHCILVALWPTIDVNVFGGKIVVDDREYDDKKDDDVKRGKDDGVKGDDNDGNDEKVDDKEIQLRAMTEGAIDQVSDDNNAGAGNNGNGAEDNANNVRLQTTMVINDNNNDNDNDNNNYNINNADVTNAVGEKSEEGVEPETG